VARIEVPMPQMGESIAEGTVSKWLKKVGDHVERDEPLLEISTDKVDAEIPAPQAGVLLEVAVEEGETVEVGTIVAYIDTEAKGAADSSDEAEDPEEDSDEDSGRDEEPESETSPAAASVAASDDGEAEPPSSTDQDDTEEDEPAVDDEEERLRTRSTPVVRRMAEEHDIDLAMLEGKGSGVGGRVTKQDLLDYLEKSSGDDDDAPVTAEKESAPRSPERASPATDRSPATAAPSDLWQKFYGEVQHPDFPVREADQVETMDKIRRLTAEHMVLAKRVAPHVHSFIEIDFTTVDRIRKESAARWKEQGARVSFTAFVVWAVSRALREFPMINATASGNNIIRRGNVNVGIAVDLDPGLIVPVIRDADNLSLVGIGKSIVDLAERARTRKLGPAEIQGATFSITNPGVLGTLVGLPIIPKGTAGILGTGAIEKRVVVVDDPVTGADTIAIRKRSIFSLGYDHRIVDGADAARFLARLKSLMEEFPEDA
jgi:pyruvate dehydrogenase E2 component (dihydrolipoamide acetyltransferase)